MFQLSYLHYLVLLLALSGFGVLAIDTKTYKKEQQQKEEKVSRFLGWTNIALGGLVYVGNWAMQMWMN